MRFWTRFSLSSSALLAAAASAVIFAAFLPSLILWGIGLAVIGVAAQIWLQLLQHRESKENQDAEDSFRFTLKQGLLPVADLIAQTSLTPNSKRQDHLKLVAVQTVTAVHSILMNDLDGVRVCIYTFDPDGSGMVPLAFFGRGETPSPFVVGTPRGDAAIANVLSGEGKFVKNIDLDETNGWRGQAPRIRASFLAL